MPPSAFAPAVVDGAGGPATGVAVVPLAVADVAVEVTVVEPELVQPNVQKVLTKRIEEANVLRMN